MIVNDMRPLRCKWTTYNIHLPHWVYQDNCKDSNCEAEGEALRNIPINPFKSSSHDEHEYGRDPYEGG